MDELLNYIKANPNWETELAEDPYRLIITHDGDYTIFKYSQIDSDFSIPLVREARGIIIYRPTMQVVCRPFSKFFNFGEPNAASIDWSHAEVTEKMDGSLIKVWGDKNGWHVSTNGMISARKAMADGAGTSFYDLFVKALPVTKDVLWQMLDSKYTYMFELVSPLNRVVIPYKETNLYYLGARSNKSGEYVKYPLPFLVPASYNYTNLEEVVEAACQFDWMREGFVVFDGVERIKVKSPAYIKAHYARNNGNISWRIIADVVRNNEQEEFLSYVSEYTDAVHGLEDKIAAFEKECNQAYGALQGEADRKSYVLKAKANYSKEVCSYLFSCFDRPRVSVRDYLCNITLPSFMRTFHLKDKT
jgi:T4 RnlA family RNA ligase